MISESEEGAKSNIDHIEKEKGSNFRFSGVSVDEMVIHSDMMEVT